LTIYIARRRKNKNHPKYKGALSAPCNHCMSLIKKCGIQKIKYIDDFDNIVSVKTKNYKDFDNIVSVKTKNYKNNHTSSGIKIMQQMKIL
jgi:deoxycytidylate deaminase